MDFKIKVFEKNYNFWQSVKLKINLNNIRYVNII